MIKDVGNKHFTGLSTDTKPKLSFSYNNYRFSELDTGKEFTYNATTGMWEVATPAIDARVDELEEKVGHEALGPVEATGLYAKLDEKQDKLPESIKNKFLHVNSKTGELEWISGTNLELKAGKDISITNQNTISVDEAALEENFATKSDLSYVREQAYAYADTAVAVETERAEKVEKELNTKIDESIVVSANVDKEYSEDLSNIEVQNKVYRVVSRAEYDDLALKIQALMAEQQIEFDPETMDGIKLDAVDEDGNVIELYTVVDK